jgi:hypothetical protein
VVVSASGNGDNEEEENTSSEFKRNTEFGYSRKDVILIGVGLIAFGYILYYGLQASGMDAGMAGNWVQLIIFLGICVGWIGSYLFRYVGEAKEKGRGQGVVMSTKQVDYILISMSCVFPGMSRSELLPRLIGTTF